jgi:hypothetical protein
MKYRIVGADGKTYGPVGLDQIRQWLAQGRLEARTPVYVEGATEWTTLAQLPELGLAFAPPPPAIGAVSQTPGAARGTNGFATMGMVCALIAWICCCCGGLPFNLLGIVFCIIALAQISSQSEPQEGRMLAILGLVLSVASLLFYMALGLLQAVFGSNTINWQTGQL